MRGNEPDQRKHRNQPKQTQTNQRNQADQAHVRSSLKKQKVQIRRPNTEVKRGDEFLSSCSQYRTSRTKLHSACWLAGIPQETHCVSVCMSETESKSEVQIRFFLGPFGAGYDTTYVKECVRAIDHVSIFKLTTTVSRTLHACGTKFQSARVFGLVPPLPCPQFPVPNSLSPFCCPHDLRLYTVVGDQPRLRSTCRP